MQSTPLTPVHSAADARVLALAEAMQKARPNRSLRVVVSDNRGNANVWSVPQRRGAA